jgi:threonylcarbamoyladenosine tRNA methylthiotransferase MtaB
MRASIFTFGCKQNYAESSAIARQLEQAGYQIVPFGEEADLVVINTCTVTETADRECRTVVRRTLRRSPDATIVVTGCYAQLQLEEIAAIEGVRLVVGNAEKHQLGVLVERARSAASPIVIRTEDLRLQDLPFTAAVFSEHDSHTRAFLKLQDGCDYSCSFCTIPHARGKSRSMPLEEIPEHVRRLVEAGYREIVLTGINLGEYRGSKGERLLDVLELLVSLEFECRYRLSSVEPNRMHSAIIEFIAQHPSICPHFHLPLQSGSPEILRQMRRRYKRELYAERVLAIKERMPHACIGADVLTGFPGESERHFEETYRFIESLPISYLHVFTYSERELTDAARRRDQVPLRIRKERTAALRALGQQKRELFAAENIGTRRNVLVEQFDPTRGGFVGYSENYCRVVVPDALPGAMVEVEILGCDGELLSGSLLSSTGLSQYVGLPVLSLGG